MKVAIKKVQVERFEVVFTVDDLLKQLRFMHGDKEVRLPMGTVLSFDKDSRGIPVIVARFDTNTTPIEEPSTYITSHPGPDGLNQAQVDVWSKIRAAGADGITYARLTTILEESGFTLAKVRMAVAVLFHAGLVHECGAETGPTGKQQKLWRSSE